MEKKERTAVKEHAELALLFSMLVTASRLERNPTYKDQGKELGLQPSLGLLAYPVLQAADILVYKTERREIMVKTGLLKSKAI